MSSRVPHLRMGLWLPTTLALVLSVLPATRVAAGAGAEPVPVLVALEPLGSLSSDGSDAAEGQRWLQRLVGELEYAEGALSPVRVIEQRLVGGSLLAYASGESGDARLRALAREFGARYAVVASVTRLGERYSVDLRMLPADEGGALLHRVLQARGESQLAAAFARASDEVRRALEPKPVERPVAAPAPALLEGAFAADPAEVAPLPPGGKIVSEVRVVGGRRIEPDAIRAVIGTRVGEPLSQERVAEDVRRIYGLGFFRDVQITSSEGSDGAIVTFHVEENPIIRRVTVTGNTSLGSEDIKEKLTLSVGSTVDFPLLIENQTRIESLYASRGHYLSEVEYEVEPLGEDSVAINFEILEGKKLRLVDIDFEGNHNLTDEELRKGLQTKTWRWYSPLSHFWDSSGLYAEPVFYQDLDRVSRTYMDSGYIRVRIGEPVVDYDDDGLRVSVPIEEGPRYSVGAIDVQGDDSMDRDELLALVSMKPGDVFRRSAMTLDVESLRGYYADRGFFFAKVEPKTEVDPDALTVDCSFAVEKGGLYFVDRIEVHGNTRTRDDVVRRELSLAEGELFSAGALARSRARVKRLGFFEEVNVDAKPTDDSRSVALDVDVVERPTGSFSFGAGFGSTDGFLLNAGVSQENLFGRGYALTANADLGSQNQAAFLRFVNPSIWGSPFSISSSLSNVNRNFEDFDQQVMGFDFSVGYPLDEGETRVFSGYSFSSRDITGLDVQAASLLQREEFQGESTTSLLSLSARRDTRDDPRFPKSGQISGFGLEFAGLGGLNQFVRLEGRTTWFVPMKKWLGFESTFVFNSRVGWAIPFNDIADFDLPGCNGCDLDQDFPQAEGEILPLTDIDTDLKLALTERYFVGGVGAFQVRGFKARTLGPRRTILNQIIGSNGGRVFFSADYDPITGTCAQGFDTCNSLQDREIDEFENLEYADVIGGNKMMLLNFELQFPISEELGLMGLVFLDMGNAFAENDAINPADFRFGTGGGVQWFSPFGPILMTLGIPIDALEDEDATVFEFSLGGSAY